VYDAIDGPLLPDAVARRTDLPIGVAVGVLIRLELRGLVRGVGGRYERTFEGLAPARSGEERGAG
jgi:predicted Rossmann fold nucleotide-binding protein DprA/Smf involved in DNA uptake